MDATHTYATTPMTCTCVGNHAYPTYTYYIRAHTSMHGCMHTYTHIHTYIPSFVRWVVEDAVCMHEKTKISSIMCMSFEYA